MALKANSTSPTVINVNQGSDFTIDFPTGTETVPKLSKIGLDGNTIYFYSTYFETTYSTTYSKYLQLQINGIFLTSTMQEVYKTGNSLSYRSFRASFSNGVLTLQQNVYQQGTSSSPSKSNLMGVDYTGTFSPNVSLTVLKYATCGSDLKEATRSAVSTYTKANLDGYVGLENDTWSGITNASSLVANEYYYIRVLVSDTNKYGKFCVRFKSYSEQTITVDNMGWGYDGDVIYSTPVWGKPYSFIANGSNCTIAASRTSSPNEHASTNDALTTGSKIYHGDVIQISILPATVQYQVTSVKINGVEQTLTSGTFETTLTVTGSININAVAGKGGSKTWHTKFSGSKSTTFSCSLENDPFNPQERPTRGWDYTNIPLSNYNITSSATENPIRITGTLKVTTKSGSTSNSATTALTANELTTSWVKKTDTVSTTVGTNKYLATSSASLRAETSNLGLRVDVSKARNLTNATGTVELTVTKVEQYY